ncbi:MAG: spermidine/putrescine ABC transporter substrate-binding protein [Myxococcales bacterium]|nr:spermidine/putrescine ABC transporter substrate-binding protein [Myxococcales bacterium]
MASSSLVIEPTRAQPSSGPPRTTSRWLPALFLTCLCSLDCSKPPSQQYIVPPLPSGQTLHVYSFKDYFVPETVAAFEAKTGNKVILKTYQTNEEMLTRLAQGEVADVVFPSSYAVETLILAHKLKPMIRERVPNIGHVPAVMRNPPFDAGLRHCVPYIWTMLGLGVLVDGIDVAREPDLAALFAEKGPRVVMPDDPRATIGMALKLLGRSPSSKKPEDLEAAKQLLLRQLPRVKDYVDDPAQSLANRSVRMSLAWSTEIFELRNRDPDVRFVVPREGTLFYVDYACVLGSSQQADVAFAFINHLLDPYTAAEITNARMLALANQEARAMLRPEARWMWGLFEGLASRSRSYEVLRDVGSADTHYQQVWKTLKDALAAQQAAASGSR